MVANSKALLVTSKALPIKHRITYDKAMLSTSQRMAEKLKEALAAKGLSQTAFAALCGASKQTVQSWVKTGRVDKKHLPKFVEILGYPLTWWLDAEVRGATTVYIGALPHANEPAATYHHSADWPFLSVSKPEYAQLTERQKGLVEGYIQGLLNEAPPAKSHGTGSR